MNKKRKGKENKMEKTDINFKNKKIKDKKDNDKMIHRKIKWQNGN